MTRIDKTSVKSATVDTPSPAAVSSPAVSAETPKVSVDGLKFANDKALDKARDTETKEVVVIPGASTAEGKVAGGATSGADVLARLGDRDPAKEAKMRQADATPSSKSAGARPHEGDYKRGRHAHQRVEDAVPGVALAAAAVVGKSQHSAFDQIRPNEWGRDAVADAMRHRADRRPVEALMRQLEGLSSRERGELVRNMLHDNPGLLEHMTTDEKAQLIEFLRLENVNGPTGMVDMNGDIAWALSDEGAAAMLQILGSATDAAQFEALAASQGGAANLNHLMAGGEQSSLNALYERFGHSDWAQDESAARPAGSPGHFASRRN